MPVKAIPEGYHSVTPYLIVDDGAAALDFYGRALGASEIMRLAMPSGKIGHAEIQVGDSRVMLADECPEMEFRGPRAFGGTPVCLMVYVEDVDSTFNRAISAGGKVLKPLQNQFYGDRSGTLEDPFGHVWTIGTHVEDVSQEEVERRAAAMAKEQEKG